MTGNRTPANLPTLEQSMDHRAWGLGPTQEPIDEPGWPVPIPRGWREERDPALYRDTECTRASACAGVATKLGWHQYGCHGCPVTDTEFDAPPPHPQRKRCLRRACGQCIPGKRQGSTDPLEPAGYFCSPRCEIIHLRRTV